MMIQIFYSDIFYSDHIYDPELLFTDGSIGKSVIILWANMSSSVHVDNKNKDILILGEGPTQGFDYNTLTAEAIYEHNQIKDLH